jgi:hypothetical protein
MSTPRVIHYSVIAVRVDSSTCFPWAPTKKKWPPHVYVRARKCQFAVVYLHSFYK